MRFLGFLLVVGGLAGVCLAGDAVPVLLWGGEPGGDSRMIAVNPLSKTSRREFEDILVARIGKSQPPFVVFVKDNLCVEDLKDHKSSFSQLSSSGSLAYLPAVESPLAVFERLSQYNLTFDNELESIDDGQLVITDVSDLTSVSETFNTLREINPDLIAGLSGRSCAYSSRSERVRRAAAPAAANAQCEKPAFCVIPSDENRVLMYASQAPSLTVKKKVLKLPEATSAMTSGNDSDLLLTLTFSGEQDDSKDKEKVKLKLNFAQPSSGYYSLKKIVYENAMGVNTDLLNRADIVFPYNFSYHCSQTTLFTFVDKDDKENVVSLNFTNLQVQIDAKSFGNAYDCVGFTSIPIWTGIFVTAILALIMIWGLTMIMDIRTMDRFDDVKGKTITISAAE